MTVGERLAAARQARGLSLEDLARRTRIPVGGLQALEADAYQRLPPSIFLRGYIRAFARETGVDASPLIAQFEAERPVPPPIEHPPAAPVDDAPRFPRTRAILFAAAAAAVIGFVIWSGDPEPSIAPPQAVERGVREPAVVTASEAVGTGGEPAAVHEAEEVSVVLTAERLCWVAAAADGRRVVYRLMQPGEREVLTARRRISLRIGDAGALAVSVNGGAPQLAGAEGMVRTLVVSAGDPPGEVRPVTSLGSRELER